MPFISTLPASTLCPARLSMRRCDISAGLVFSSTHRGIGCDMHHFSNRSVWTDIFSLCVQWRLVRPFRPGNAWGEDALALSTWPYRYLVTLNVGKGLISAAPIFFFSLLGWAVLAQQARPQTTRRGRLVCYDRSYERTAPGLGLWLCLPSALSHYGLTGCRLRTVSKLCRS